MKLRDTPENRVVQAVMLATSARVDWLRNPAGVGTMKSGVTMRIGLGGILGTSDWIGIVRASGRIFALETKAPGKKPDIVALDKTIRSGDYCPNECRHPKCRLVHQELFLRRIRASGGIGIFADCPEDIIRAIEEAR